MRRAASVAVLALVAIAVAVGAQDEAPASFGETVAVRVVNVDVWVTDKDGRPIEGLTRDDFRLFEDGIEVEIANFYVAGTESTTAADASQIVAAAESEVVEDASPLPVLELDEPIYALVYVDHNTLNIADRGRALDDLRAFVEQHSGADVRFALVAADRGAKVRTSFTADSAAFLAALDSISRRAPSLGQESVDFRRAVNEINDLIELDTSGGCTDENFPRLLQAWETYAAQAERRVDTAIGNLAEIISSLGGLPGRKALFFVSSGLQQRPGVELLEYLAQRCPIQLREVQTRMWRHDQSAELEELAARANANRVTLHTLDAAGLRPEEAASVESSSLDMRPSPLVTDLRRTNLQNSLWILADRTGGRAIFHANQPLPELARGLAEQWQGYSLGFTPLRPPDGENHRLRVELRPEIKGATLRFRRSYRDTPEAERLESRLMAALRLGVGANPLAITAEAGSPERADRKLYKVPLRIRVPGAGLMTNDPGEGPLIRLFLVAQDEDGGRSDLRQGRMRLAAGSSMHEVAASLVLSRGRHRIVVGVRDEIGEVLSVLSLDVPVGTG